MQILRDTSATLSAIFYNADGSVIDPGVTIVTITRADGSVVVSGAPTGGTGAAARIYTLPPQPNLTILTVVWTAADGSKVTQTHEVVGNLLFTLGQARAFDAAKLVDPAKYPTADIISARDRITDNIEHITGVSWIPRFKRVTLNGSDNDFITVSDSHVTSILTATVDGTPYTASEIADLRVDEGYIYRDTLGRWAGGTQNVILEYVHGFPYLQDGVDYIALRWLVHMIVGSNLPRNAIQEVSNMGTFRLSVPGEKYATGIPEVDAWLSRHDYTLPGVA